MGTDNSFSLKVLLRTVVSISTLLALVEAARYPQETVPNITDASQNFSTWRRDKVSPQTVIPLEPRGLENRAILNGNILYLVSNPEGRKLPFQLNHTGEKLNQRESYPRTNFLRTLRQTVKQKPISSLVPKNMEMLKNLTDVSENEWDNPVPHMDWFSGYEKCGLQDETFMPEFRDCVTNGTRGLDFMVCPLVLRTDREYGCDYQHVELSSVFANLTVDFDISNFAEGGPDSDGQWWPGTQLITDYPITLLPSYQFENQSNVEEIYNDFNGTWWPNKNISFASALGQQALGDPSFQCSLASPCAPTLTCESVGCSSPSIGRRRNPTAWAYLALVSLKNINSQLSNQYVGIKGAAILANLKAFAIQDFYPEPKQSLSIGNLVSAFASAFAFLGGFASGVGVGAAAVDAVGGFLSATANPSTKPMVPIEVYTDSIGVIYQSMIVSLDNITDSIFNGSDIGGFSILDMIQGGTWVKNTALKRVSNIEESLRIEIISRSIDRLWKTPTSNKMFVLFVQTANCSADFSGPPDLKYCADGGVYYAYNFIENGDGIGHLGYPWGTEKMWDTLKIEPKWIVEASAKTYRTSRIASLDPFDFNFTAGTAAFLSDSIGIKNSTSFDDLPGRIPGSWTLPVCNASDWGAAWNWNFVNKTTHDIQKFPCICGPGGNETEVWAKAAGMENFRTYYETCKSQLLDEESNFQWPDGVKQVNFTGQKPIKRPGS